jgi:hypothetical protein
VHRVRITYVQHLAAGREIAAEVFDHLLQQDVLAARAERHRTAIGKGDRDAP